MHSGRRAIRTSFLTISVAEQKITSILGVSTEYMKVAKHGIFYRAHNKMAMPVAAKWLAECVRDT